MPGIEDLYRELSAAADRRDLEAILELVHPEVEIVARRSAIQGEYHGAAGTRKFWEDTFLTFTLFSARADEQRLLDDASLLVIGEIEIEARGSGIRTHVPFAAHIVAREGRLFRWHDYGQRDLALDALGLEN